jgi:hypothetical protein
VTAIGVPLLLVLACTGAGAPVLAVFGLWRDKTQAERLAWAFALGLGVVGWLVFPLGVAGHLGTMPLLTLCAVCALGNLLLLQPAVPFEGEALGTIGRILVALLCLIALFDGLEALAPPTDADSLAYHFALPKLFLTSGRIDFVPRAVDGAVPLLLHMTYLVALALGGETAMTVWTGLSGWAAAALLFVLARRFMPLDWSLALVVVFLTTPAMIYGAGSGQVEARLAVFALAAVFLIADSWRDGRLATVALAALAAGFYAGSKITGLIFLASCGLVMVIHRQWFSRGTVFALVATLAAGQWYLWNYLHTGDPVFPMLHLWFGWDNPPLWPADQSAYFRGADLNNRIGVPRTLFWLFSYPVKATFDDLMQFESGRTGLGPLALLLIPFAITGVWVFRRRLRSSRLMPVVAVVGLYYVLWFFLGGSQKVRHLLPVYPAVLLCAVYAARLAVGRFGAGRPLMAALVLTLAVQLGAHGLFSKAFAARILNGTGRDAFVARMVPDAAPVKWINENLDQSDRLLLFSRHFLYLLDIPYFYAKSQYQRLIDTRETTRDAKVFLSQIQGQGITYVLGIEWPLAQRDRSPPFLLSELRNAGCLAPTRRFAVARYASRTLPTLISGSEKYELFRIVSKDCEITSP